MKQIIRIQHSAGTGMWRTRDKNGNWLIRQHSMYGSISKKHMNMPTPYFDDELTDFDDENDFCAFKSIESFQEWIADEWINELLEMGYRILLIQIEITRESQYQVLFKKQDIIQITDISDLFIQCK